MIKKRLLVLGMALSLLTGALAGCGQTAATPTATPTPTPSKSIAPESTTPSSYKATVNFSVLKGPSGVGAAGLIAANDAGESANDYSVSIFSSNDEVASGLTSGSIDIAAVASNVAANLYNKTDGAIQAVAISGLGVLYILENGDTVHSMADLKGQTIYAVGQGANPEYVLNYLLTENGVDPSDVDIQWKTADEVSALMASGEAKLCMLPVPAATAVLMKNTNVREALDLSSEWDNLNNGSRLTMTMLVVRTAFAQEHPQAVENFLADYQKSVTEVTDDPVQAAETVAKYEITPTAQIAQAAIPKCALVCVTGVNNIRNTIQGYYGVLFQANPQSIGGSIPDDGFYYGS